VSSAQDGHKPGKLRRVKKTIKVLRNPPPDEPGYSETKNALPAAVPGAKAVNKPSKKKPKSVEIILNSDEPEELAHSAAAPSAEQFTHHAASRPLETDSVHSQSEKFTAPRRRLSWTPPRDTERPDTAGTAVSITSDSPPAHRVPLSELIGNFGYAGIVTTATKRTESGEALTKRRRIELGESSITGVPTRKPLTKAPTTEPASLRKPAPKVKKPKKKPQTITALATAAYQPAQKPSSTQGTVSEFFAPQKPTDNEAREHPEPLAPEGVKPKKPRKPRTKTTSDGAAINRTAQTAKAKKVKITFSEAEHRPKLYSPERASEQMKQQDFLFGTSSQLAVEESPTFIRDVQIAIRDSELAPMSQTATSPPRRSYAAVPTAPHGTNLSIEQTSKELWCSGARDFNGGVLRGNSGLSKQTLRRAADELPKPALTGPDAVPAVDGCEEGRRVVDLCDTSPVFPSNQQRLPSVASPLTRDRIEEAQKLPAPQSIPLKEQSWHDIEEISDPESPATPSPPRRRATSSPPHVRPLQLEISGSPVPAALSSTALLKPTDPQWWEVCKELFTRITRTIRSCPRNTNPETPSWHQKILLYDPIIVEDLATYLNTQDLRVSVRRQKRKSVPAKKKGRSKKDAEQTSTSAAVEAPRSEVEVVDEELQPWMVQKWCEEHSVCCVLKESLWGGSRKRY